MRSDSTSSTREITATPAREPRRGSSCASWSISPTSPRRKRSRCWGARRRGRRWRRALRGWWKRSREHGRSATAMRWRKWPSSSPRIRPASTISSSGSAAASYRARSRSSSPTATCSRAWRPLSAFPSSPSRSRATGNASSRHSRGSARPPPTRSHDWRRA